jgi:hypothetical protein
VSKLLLRHGFVYSGGNAWTGPHDRWLREQHFTHPTTQMTFESDYETVLAVTARRDRLDTAITAMAADSEFTPVVYRLGCLRGMATLTGFALAVEIGDWCRFARQQHRLLRRPGAQRELLRRLAGARLDHQDRQTPTPADCSSRPPGTTNPATYPARPCATGGNWPHPPPEPAAMPATGGCTPAGSTSTCAARRP